MVGEHKISVVIQGQATAGSPYSSKVYDVNAIKVKNVTNGTVGSAVTFLVETAQAGPGNLEVTVNDGRVPTSAQAQGQHTYAISFTPREAMNHTVELRFNGQDVPGSPFTCNIASAARIIGIETLDKVNVGQEFDFFVQSSVLPVAEILGPARRSVSATIEEVLNPTGFKIKFKPIDVGDHSIEVRLPPNGSHVEGSPFLLKAYSAEKVVVSDIKSGIVGKSVSFSINASQAGAGNLEIIVAVNGKNVPNFVTSEGNARFKVNFKPIEAARHSLSIRFNGHSVPGSPFNCNILQQPVSSLKVMANGEALRQAPINVENIFELEGFDMIEPQIYITGPTGDNVPCKLKNRNNVWIASFQPLIVGRHLISVSIGEQHIAGSPFNCNVFDVSQVSISGLNSSLPSPIGIPITFNVDAAGAGEGTLELVVSTASNTVKAEVTACARGLYDVTFIPQTAESHFVNITFNDIPIHGNPFKCDVQQNIQNIQVGSPVTVDLISDDYILEVLGPNRKIIPYTSGGKRKAEFKTLEIGTYVIRFSDRDTKAIISSRNINVFNANMVKVVEVGQAICYRPANIVVSLAESGAGTLSATVKCGSLEVPYSIRQSKNSLWEIVYHPTRVAPHKVLIMFNGTPISMKPIEIVVMPPSSGKEICVHGLGLYQAHLGKTTSFAIDTNGRPASEFDVVVEQLLSNSLGSGSQTLPVRCYQTKSGHLQAEFTAQGIGKCKIDVLHQSKPLIGSPFICECFDPSKIRVKNLMKSNLVVNQTISFSLDTSEAGKADVDISVLSPNGQHVPLTVSHKESEEIVEFLPLISGHYKCFVLYGGEQVKTPITFAVSSLNMKSDIRAFGNGLEVAHRGKESSFKTFCPSIPSVQIDNIIEEGKKIEPRIKSLGNSEWQVFYTILNVGRYEIRVSCSNRGPFPGSPWIISCVDSTKVTASNGWSSYIDEEGRLILPANIKLNTKDAGPGELLCLVDGSELSIVKENEDIQDIYIPANGLSFGEHNIELLWSGTSIGQCPVKAFVISQNVTDKIRLSGRGLSVAQVGEVSQFLIDASEIVTVGGTPEATLRYPDNFNVPVNIQEKSLEKGVWLASYLPPKECQTPLLLNVKWCGKLIKGSPFTVSLGSPVDSSKVKCSGEGLRHGVVGQQIKSWIDTRRAGPSELSAHCSGPRKVAYCELYDHGDATFTLNIKPQEPGRHVLTIKYGGQHVPGSPYTLRVVGAPDASKVRVYGPGIEHGVLASFQSRFICDTRGAGAGQLTVRVRGPKGAFRVEMQRESQKDRTILCKYDPTEPGDYRVEVKWANELVPGSPFPVMIFDTQEELRRFLSVTP